MDYNCLGRWKQWSGNRRKNSLQRGIRRDAEGVSDWIGKSGTFIGDKALSVRRESSSRDSIQSTGNAFVAFQINENPALPKRAITLGAAFYKPLDATIDIALAATKPQSDARRQAALSGAEGLVRGWSAWSGRSRGPSAIRGFSSKT